MDNGLKKHSIEGAKTLRLTLAAETAERLERIREEAGRDSVEAVVHDALDLYVRLRSPLPESAEKLTPRLRQVLEMIAKGSSTKEIAQKLGISVKTADWHRSQLMKALNLHGVVDLVRYAIRCGIIEP